MFRATIRERISCWRMQNRHTQNKKTSQAKRRHSARRSRHLIYEGMAAVCVLVLFLAAGRIGKRNSAEASGQSDMILAENKKSTDGTDLEVAECVRYRRRRNSAAKIFLRKAGRIIFRQIERCTEFMSIR